MKTWPYEGNDQVIQKLGMDSLKENWYEIAGVQDSGKAWNKYCEFTVVMNTHNLGMKIRRRYDGEWPANVELFKDNKTRVVPAQEVWVFIDGNSVGSWYLPAHHARNCWMEDEFEIPKEFTEGKDRVAIKLENIGEYGWSDYRYWIFSYIPF